MHFAGGPSGSSFFCLQAFNCAVISTQNAFLFSFSGELPVILHSPVSKSRVFTYQLGLSPIGKALTHQIGPPQP